VSGSWEQDNSEICPHFIIIGIGYVHKPQFTPHGFLHKCLNKQFELDLLHISMQLNCS